MAAEIGLLVPAELVIAMVAHTSGVVPQIHMWTLSDGAGLATGTLLPFLFVLDNN